MKTFITFLTFFLFSSIIYSQTTNTGFIGNLGGGISVPAGDLSDGWKAGFNIFGSGGYVFHGNFGARIDLQYNSFPRGRDASVVSGGTFGIFSIKADFLAGDFDRKSVIMPYGLLGIGLFVNTRGNEITESFGTFTYDTETAFGFGIGGGMGYRLSNNIMVFGEAQFDLVFEIFPTPAYLPLKAGIMFIL